MTHEATHETLDDKIVKALEDNSNPKTCWHCVEQIAKVTGEDPWTIYKALHTDARMPEVIQRDFGGWEFFTTKKRYNEVTTPWQRFWRALAGEW